jgi:hypothetical protein
VRDCAFFEPVSTTGDQRVDIPEPNGRVQRHNRVVAKCFCVVGLVAFLVCATGCSSGGEKQSTTTTLAIGSGIGYGSSHGYVPRTRIEGANAVLPVTLPDSETLTLRYPVRMQIAQLGFSGAMRVRWVVSRGVSACCGALVLVTYETVADVYGHAKPIAVYAGAHGESVPLIQAPQISCDCSAPYVNEEDLVFRFGGWLVRDPVAGSMTPQQRAIWARSLSGSVNSDGYLVLRARAPLSISDEFDGGFGVDGGPAYVRLTSHSTDLPAHLVCTHSVPGKSVRSRSHYYAGTVGVAWCVGNDLHVSVTGKSAFVDLAAKNLRVTSLAQPPTGVLHASR